jgi:MFS family permease
VQGGLIGRLQKAFGEARLVAAGMVIGGLALGSLSYLPSLLSTGLVLMCLAFGTGIINPSLSSLTSSFAEPDEVGGVLGIYQGLGSLGRILGPFVGEVVFGIDYHWPYRVACIATLGAAAFAFTLLVRLRRSAA